MYTNQTTAFDTLTLNSLLNNLVNDPSDNVVSGSLKPSTDALTVSPQLLSSLNQSLVSISSLEQPLSPSNTIASETVTDTKSDVLEVLGATSDDVVLFNFNQLSLGAVETNAVESLGRLFNDPIEYGNPLSDIGYWRQQQGNFSCAVVAQISIYQSLTGQYIPEDVACNYAQQQGWFDPATGTLIPNIGHILNAWGIGTYQQYNASLSSLEHALAMGDKPIVALDANEIWYPQSDIYGNPLEQVDVGHAVWVTGIDYELDGSIGIVINDSGTSYGMPSVVEYHNFMNSWQDSTYFVTVADNPFI